jgi:hypothetical protein
MKQKCNQCMLQLILHGTLRRHKVKVPDLSGLTGINIKYE